MTPIEALRAEFAAMVALHKAAQYRKTPPKDPTGWEPPGGSHPKTWKKPDAAAPTPGSERAPRSAKKKAANEAPHAVGKAAPEPFEEFKSLLGDILARTRLRRPELLRRLVVDLGAAGHRSRPARPTLTQFLRNYGHLGENALTKLARDHVFRHFPTH